MSVVGYKRYSSNRSNEDDEDEMSKFMKMVEDDNGEEDDHIHTAAENKKLIQEKISRYKRAKQEDVINIEGDCLEASSDLKEEKYTSSLDNNNTVDTKRQSLLLEAAEMRKQQSQMNQTSLKQQKQQYSESQLLKEANQVQTNALQSSEEIATGVKYTDSLKTTWRYIQ